MKRCVLRMLEVCAYWSGFDSIFYFLNRHAKRTLCFHHVLPDDVFVPHVSGFELCESDFRRLIVELKKCFTFSNDLGDPSSITLTFDDGWRNQFETAARILEDLGNIPAMLFVTGRLLDETNPRNAFVAELLAHWVAFVPRGRHEFIFRGVSYVFELTNAASQREFWRDVVWPLFNEDAEDMGAELLNSLDECYPFKSLLCGLNAKYLRLRLQGVSKSELEVLKSRGWVIGWHTENHYPLRLLSSRQKKQEMIPPNFVDKTVFAYPYGSTWAVDEATIKIAAQLGYQSAVSFMQNPSSMMGRYFLPRMEVPSERYALHFTLSGLRYFLKTKKLLPRVEE